jgi:predicted Ser/Thr protein kinase
MPEFARGDVFVGHRIEGLAGRGGMGVVYRATQLDLDRIVALKVITPALADDPDFRARFVAESKSAASIEHPNVLPVYYAGEREGVLFIVMRYVDGADLRTLVRANARLEPDRAAHIVAQVAAALDAAHAHGLVHRDVKPANVLLGPDDHAYLTDFGLTKRADATVDSSRSGSGWVGTLGYVAPEQIRGDRIDARTDVYALGCVLVHALTGSAPFMRESDEATLWAHLNSPPPADKVPSEFAGVVERALSKEPGDRYPSAGDLGRAALAAAGRSGVAAPERVVARGAAAPPGTTAADPDEETHPSPPESRRPGPDREKTRIVPVAPRAPAPRPRRGRVIALAGVIAAVVVGAVVLMSGDKDSSDKGGTPRGLSADTPVQLVTRPNSLAFTGDKLAVLSARSGDLAFVDAATGQPGQRVSVGSSASAVSSGFGLLWVTKFRTKSLLRVDPQTLLRAGAAIALPTPGLPVTVVAGEHAVWVATHEADGIDNVIKVTPRGRVVRTIPVVGGIQDLAVGDGAVWVTNRTRTGLVRIGVRDGSQRTLRVGGKPQGLAVGEGAVWVAGARNDTMTRVDTKSLRSQTFSLNVTPDRVAVGGGSVWVTARSAATLIRIDPRRRTVSATIPTGHGPFAIGVHHRTVWVGLVEDNAIQRVRF